MRKVSKLGSDVKTKGSKAKQLLEKSFHDIEIDVKLQLSLPWIDGDRGRVAAEA